MFYSIPQFLLYTKVFIIFAEKQTNSNRMLPYFTFQSPTLINLPFYSNGKNNSYFIKYLSNCSVFVAHI